MIKKGTSFPVRTYEHPKIVRERHMKLVMSTGALGLAILASLAMPPAYADEWGGGGYIGGNFGRSSASNEDRRIVERLLDAGFVTQSIVNDDRDNGFKLFGGYSFNRYFAIEGGYFNLGRFGYTATTLPARTLNGSTKFQGVNLDLVGSVPIGEKFSLFGRFGGTYGESRNIFVETGPAIANVFHRHSRGGNYKFGVGLQYNINESLAVRAEGERYRVDDFIGGQTGHVDLLSLGLIYRFGGMREVARPEPVAYVAPPQPAMDCSTMDDDRDGVNNCNDHCPASPAGQVVGQDGCPVPAQEPVAEPPKPFRG